MLTILRKHIQQIFLQIWHGKLGVNQKKTY